MVININRVLSVIATADWKTADKNDFHFIILSPRSWRGFEMAADTAEVNAYCNIHSPMFQAYNQ